MNRTYVNLFKKVSLSSFLIALIAPVLSGCTSTTEQDSEMRSHKTPATKTTSTTPTDSDDDTTLTAITTDAITLDQARCISCGKCPRFAPDNFAMDPITGKAIVISQDNAQSTAVERAKSACPTNAIKA